MPVCKARSDLAASFDSATGNSSFAKKGWLARMAYTCLSGDLCRVRGSSCGERAASSPHKLQSSKDSHHGHGRFQLVRGNSWRQ